MRIMTKRQERIYNNLLLLAGGDPMLVEQALRAFGSGGNTADLSEVIAYIQKQKAAGKQNLKAAAG